jgi:hypothetical protein
MGEPAGDVDRVEARGTGRLEHKELEQMPGLFVWWTLQAYHLELQQLIAWGS